MNEYSNKIFLSSPNHIRRGRKGEGGNKFENILVQWTPSPSPMLVQSLSLLLVESPGVEEHPEDNDLTEENDCHEVAPAIQAHGYCALELKYSVSLLINIRTSSRNFSSLPA